MGPNFIYFLEEFTSRGYPKTHTLSLLPMHYGDRKLKSGWIGNDEVMAIGRTVRNGTGSE